MTNDLNARCQAAIIRRDGWELTRVGPDAATRDAADFATLLLLAMEEHDEVGILQAIWTPGGTLEAAHDRFEEALKLQKD